MHKLLSDMISDMKTTYETVVIGFGNHASIEIPDKNLNEIGGNKRAPLKITVNRYTYQSTATGVNGKCMVVFPTRDREASGAAAGDRITVTLELDDGYRQVDVPAALSEALALNGLSEAFHNLTYSKRKEFARQVSEAKAEETRTRRIEKIICHLKQ
jgi:bifunctional DNA-binding transcriptional regulator/antitoxin component of YhaV-PrlF toxin-antitoxin module